MVTVGGIDGCRAGWLCLTKDLDRGSIEGQILARIDQILMFDPCGGSRH